jgi:hypothetical protein
MIMFLRNVAQLSLIALLSAPAMTTSTMAAEPASRPHMDLAFCIDTTGSMQNEIDMVKTKTKELVAKLATGKPAPIVRVGLVAYRDRGDEYVTKVFPFTDDIDHVVKDISSLQAAGGGDGPESVNEGLHVALNTLQWSDDKHTAKLLFLIGDAPPHFYVNDYKWEDESKNAISRGIQINPIACRGLESYPAADGTEVFQKIAKLTDGKYDTLSYRQEVADAAGKKTTVVTRGGDSYKVDARARDWKSAVASGRLEKMSEPVASAAPMPVRAAHMAGYGGAMMRASLAAPMAAPMADSRADSNLDEIVLDAARAKATKALNVHY